MDFVIVFNGGNALLSCGALLFFVLWIVSFVDYLFQGRMFLETDGLNHLDGILVGEDGEVGLGLEEEYVAVFVVLADALYAAAGHGDAALAVGQGEELVAGARGHNVVALQGGELDTVAQEDDGLGLALCCHAGDVVDGDIARFRGLEEDIPVIHHAVVPVFLDGEGAVLVVFVVAVLEASAVVALAAQLSVVVIGHETTFEAAIDIVAGDVAILAHAFPPAAMSVVVGPGSHLGSVAVVLEDDVAAILDAHLVIGFFDEAAVLGVELPEAVAVALVVFATGEEPSLLVVCFVHATLAGLGIGVADAHGAVMVIVGEDTGLEAVLEIAFENLGAVLVGADPVALAATLFVNLVLGCGADGGEHHGRGKEENTFFHRMQWMCIIICIYFNNYVIE